MKMPRLFVGPMSREIVDIAVEYTKEKRTLGLIPSRRQIEHTGGYVNNWTTGDFSQYVKEKSDSVYLVRDHGGPGQGSAHDDGLDSLKNDIENRFDMVHIDPWKTCSSVEEGVRKTEELIFYCMSLDDNVLFEVGTEESIFPYTSEDLDFILSSLQKSMGSEFDRVKFGVIQSGVKISGTSNVGNFDPDRLEDMVKIAKKHGILSKEHNGDYLSREQIQKRASLGLDAINIAPEFGVTQTRLLLEHGIRFDDALRTCKKVNKFSKWIPEEHKSSPPERMIVEVSGHYCFTEEPFRSLLTSVRESLAKKLFSRFDEICGAWE